MKIGDITSQLSCQRFKGELVLGTFVLPKLYAQDFLFAFQHKAEDGIGDKLADYPILPHGIMSIAYTMTETQRNIFHQLQKEYDIQTAEDIQNFSKIC